MTALMISDVNNPGLSNILIREYFFKLRKVCGPFGEWAYINLILSQR